MAVSRASALLSDGCLLEGQEHFFKTVHRMSPLLKPSGTLLNANVSFPLSSSRPSDYLSIRSSSSEMPPSHKGKLASAAALEQLKNAAGSSKSFFCFFSTLFCSYENNDVRVIQILFRV